MGLAALQHVKSSQFRDPTHISCGFLTTGPPGKSVYLRLSGHHSNSADDSGMCWKLTAHHWLRGGFLGASLVAQRLKPLPAMWETQVQSLGREDPLEKEMATHSSILAWRIPWMEEPGSYSPWCRKESDMTEWLHSLTTCIQHWVLPSEMHQVLYERKPVTSSSKLDKTQRQGEAYIARM